MPAFFDGSSRVRMAKVLAMRSVYGRDMHFLQRALPEQLLVDLDLIGDAQVVGHLDQNDAVLQRLGFAVADERADTRSRWCG